MDILKLLDQAMSEFGRVLKLAQAGQWQNPTPCSEWDVKMLTNHVVNEVLWIPDMLAGKTIAQVGDKYDGDVLGLNPYSSWQASYTKAKVAISDPRVTGKTVHLSYGDTPVQNYIAQMIGDQTIHTWDLAKGLGVNPTIDPELLAFCWGYFSKEASNWRKAGAFSHEVTTTNDNDIQTKLLALTGRDANWTAPKL